jgi:hypothetical protein
MGFLSLLVMAESAFKKTGYCSDTFFIKHQIMHCFGSKKTTFFSAKRPVTFKSPAIAFSGK